MKMESLGKKFKNGNQEYECIAYTDKPTVIMKNIATGERVSVVVDSMISDDFVEIIEEEKKIPEKLVDILKVDDLEPPYDSNLQKIWVQTIKNYNKINEICDYLKSKGE